MAPTTLRTLFVALCFCGACDCEEKIRRTLSDPGDRQAADATNEPSGPSESEPNDAREESSPIVIGNELRPVAGEVGLPDDVDWFAFSVEGGSGSFALSVEPDASLDLSLHVDVPDGAPLTYDAGRRGDPERIPVFRLGPKPQRFAIRSESSSTGSYEIRLERHLGSGLEAEPNDETNVATPFDVPGELEGFYDRPDDRDVYRLNGAPGTPFVIEISAIDGVRQIARVFQDAKLNDPNLTLQISNEPVRIPNLGLSADAVRWLVLTPLTDGDPNRPYRVRVAKHPELEGDLELEPNDDEGMVVGSFPAAYRGYLHSADDRDRFALSAGEDAAGSGAESAPRPQRERPSVGTEPGEAIEDPLKRFRKEAPEGVTVNALLRWSDEESDLGLRWIEGTDAKSFRRTSTERRVRACGLALGQSGVLEVRSSALAGAPAVGEPNYSLEIASNDAEGDSEIEPNDTADTADVLEPGAARGGTLATSGDVDYWVFHVPGEELQTSSVSLRAGGEGVDLELRVVDDGGGVVANVNNSAVGGTEKLTVDLPAGTYFVATKWKGGELCGSYEIEMSQ